MGLTKALGPDADMAVTECTRVMRAPGTMNFPNAAKMKLGRVLAPCGILEWDSSRQYSFDAFDKYRELGREPWRTRNQGRVELIDIKAGWAGGIPASVETLIQSVDQDGNPVHPALVARWFGNSEGLRDRSGSGIDLSIANYLARRQVEPQDIARALMARSAQLGDPEKGTSYYRHTISKAVASSKEQISPLAEGHDRVEPSLPTFMRQSSPLELQ